MERVIGGETKERWGTTVQRNKKNGKKERTKEMETEKRMHKKYEKA